MCSPIPRFACGLSQTGRAEEDMRDGLRSGDGLSVSLDLLVGLTEEEVAPAGDLPLDP